MKIKNETLSNDVLALLNEWEGDYTRELGYCDPDHFDCPDGRELDLFTDDLW